MNGHVKQADTRLPMHARHESGDIRAWDGAFGGT